MLLLVSSVVLGKERDSCLVWTKTCKFGVRGLLCGVKTGSDFAAAGAAPRGSGRRAEAATPAAMTEGLRSRRARPSSIQAAMELKAKRATTQVHKQGVVRPQQSQDIVCFVGICQYFGSK